jgi:hypothetical protein
MGTHSFLPIVLWCLLQDGEMFYQILSQWVTRVSSMILEGVVLAYLWSHLTLDLETSIQSQLGKSYITSKGAVTIQVPR